MHHVKCRTAFLHKSHMQLLQWILHSPVTAFGFSLFLGGSSDPFGGFADFSSPAASASFPSSQGRIDVGIAVLLKGGRRARDAMWHY